MRRPFMVSTLIGMPLIIVGLLVTLIGPAPAKLPRGFITPVVAFEFVTEIEHVNQIFAGPNSAAQADLVRTMTNSTHLDFLFLILYGAFLFAFSITCVSLTGKKFYYFVTLLAVVAPLFDLLENLQMLSIIDQLDAGSFITELQRLQLFTWLKWSALAVSFVLLLPFFWSAGKFGQFLSIIAAAPIVLGLIAFFKPGLPNELFAISTILTFLLMIFFSFTFRTN